MSFDQLGLSAGLQRAVKEKGYTKPTPIQTQAIPAILHGSDMLAGAQTGTGKTAGFTLPILQRLSECENKNRPRTIRALILTPTRELAAQVDCSVKDYSRHLPIKSTPIFGGVKINPQIEILRKGIDVLVATPGRLLDHLQQQTIDLSNIEIFVLDEADRMLDMGFIRDIRRIISFLPEHKQTLLFSATFSREIRQLSNGLLKSPEIIEVASRNTAADRIDQVIHPVDKSRKRELLSFMIGSQNWHQVLVFTRTKHGSNRLTEQLKKDGISAAAIHGNKSQGARTKALDNFKRNKIRVLVATDIAARGLDIDQLPHVVNFELPNVAEDYVHRIGRTGRAGNKGVAISLVCSEEQKLLHGIERLLKQKLPKDIVEGYEPESPLTPARGHKTGNDHRPPANKRNNAKATRQRRRGPSPKHGGQSQRQRNRRKSA